MINDKIEHNVVIEAPIDTVWRIVTEPEHIAEWFSDAAEIDPRPGGAGVLTFGDPSSADAKVQPFFVETYEPTSRFSFRWCHEDSNDQRTKSLLVEFTLTADGDNTLLQMVESGHSARWDADIAQESYDDHVNGWNVIVPRLAEQTKQKV